MFLGVGHGLVTMQAVTLARSPVLNYEPSSFASAR